MNKKWANVEKIPSFNETKNYQKQSIILTKKKALWGESKQSLAKRGLYCLFNVFAIVMHMKEL